MKNNITNAIYFAFVFTCNKVSKKGKKIPFIIVERDDLSQEVYLLEAETLMKGTEEEMSTWKKILCSKMGRINIVKCPYQKLTLPVKYKHTVKLMIMSKTILLHFSMCSILVGTYHRIHGICLHETGLFFSEHNGFMSLFYFYLLNIIISSKWSL